MNKVFYRFQFGMYYNSLLKYMPQIEVTNVRKYSKYFMKVKLCQMDYTPFYQSFAETVELMGLEVQTIITGEQQ